MSYAFKARLLRASLCAAASCAALSVPAEAAQAASRRDEILKAIATLNAELADLDAAALAEDARRPAADAGAASAATADDPAATLVEEVRVNGVTPEVADRPLGQTADAVTAAQFEHQPLSTIADMLVAVPGVTMVAGNGPRDISISVRGSNARQTFGVRNVQVFEDGFPVTQPDGLARTDLTDPHAYGRIDVIKGPSSALYGNYAIGGAIRFQLRSGRDLDGFELGVEGGGDGYRNVFFLGGGATDKADVVGFVSYVTGDGYRQHTSYRSTTVNGLATYAVTPADRLTVKVINNDTDANLSIRQSLQQYRLNPYQDGCEVLAAPGCASLSLFVNGFNGARQNVSAVQAGSNRNDRRTIVGARWEHDFDQSLTGRAQVVWDNRDIKQPTGATSAVGTFPSFNLLADLTHKGGLGGRATLYGAVFYNTENINSSSFNVPLSGAGTPGGLTQQVNGSHANYGARARAEYDVADGVVVIAGLGFERTDLKALQTAYAYPTTATATLSRIRGDRRYTNWAPEAAVTWRASDALQLHAHVGAAYGTPQVTNLFITSAGVPGNNTDLKAQRMVGVDLGADLRLAAWANATLTIFNESYRNELVTQSAGANLQSFTFNAPRSRHRGLEAAVNLKPLPDLLPGLGAQVSYLVNRQTYRSYQERLSAGSLSAVFDRSGAAIPGVPRSNLYAKVSYDQASGVLEGLGVYAEWNRRPDTFMDNANLLKAPGYSLLNLGVHYDPPEALGALSRLRFYASIQNIEDKVYVASAGNVADSISATTGVQNGAAVLETVTGSIYAGAPRTVVVGVRARF